MVTLHGVSKSYFEGQRVLDQVSMDLKQGDFLYLVGGSGAGKSTLLRLLATEEPPSSPTGSARCRTAKGHCGAASQLISIPPLTCNVSPVM